MRRKITCIGGAVVGLLSVISSGPLANAEITRAPEPGKVSLAYVPSGFALQPEGLGVSYDDIDEAFIYTARNRRSAFIVASGYEFGDGKRGNRCQRKIPVGVSAKRVSVRVNGVKSAALYLRGLKLIEFLLPESAIAKPKEPYPSTSISALLKCADSNDLAISLGKILSPQALARRVENPTKADSSLVMTEWHASSNIDRQRLSWLGDGQSVTVESFWDQRPAEGVVFFAVNQTQVAGIPASIDQSPECTTLEWLAQPGARVRLQGCGISVDEVRKIAAGLKVESQN